MADRSAPPNVRRLLTSTAAVWAVFALWPAYTALYTLELGETLSAAFEFVPGLLGVSALLAAGFSPEACHLRRAPLTRRGLTLLGLSFLVGPIMWLTGRWTGWKPAQALIYAPATGISQELYFRAALLPALLTTLRKRSFLAVVLQALLFALWHVPTTYLTAPLGAVAAVATVTFGCGILWGEQVRHDGTVLWLMGYHTLLLVGNSFFTW